MVFSALLKAAAFLTPKEVGLRGKESVSPLRLQVHLPVLTQEARAS